MRLQMISNVCDGTFRMNYGRSKLKTNVSVVNEVVVVMIEVAGLPLQQQNNEEGRKKRRSRL